MAARSGMADLILTLRGMTAAATGDFSIGTVAYFTDNHLQDALDAHRADFFEETLAPVQQVRNGTTYYLEYRSQYGNLETVASGTGVFKLDNAAGTNYGTGLWTADYTNGIVTFNADTLGSSVLLTARAYDLNAAAADVWRQKAAYYAAAYNISSDMQQLQRGQLIQHALLMADYYGGQARPVSINLMRGDMYVTE